MSFNCGIVGLPNVGKSTIFNAITNAGAQMSNYPFTTVEPNKGIVILPDERIGKIQELMPAKKVTPAHYEFVDVAGLVRNAHSGEGLGNQFLGNIKTVDVIVHVVRCFNDDDVTHVEGDVNPERDAELIETELLLSDLQMIEKRIERIKKPAQTGDKELKIELEILERAEKILADGRWLREEQWAQETDPILKQLSPLTMKKLMYAGNVSEGDVGGDSELSKKLKAYAEKRGAPVVFICGKLEQELSELPAEEKNEFLETMGLSESALPRLVKAGYKFLGLNTFYTNNGNELRAWSVATGTTALKAAGKIHSDMERGFIRAEVISTADLFREKSEQEIRKKGLLRQEGKEYLVCDGDMILFRFNV